MLFFGDTGTHSVNNNNVLIIKWLTNIQGLLYVALKGREPIP